MKKNLFNVFVPVVGCFALSLVACTPSDPGTASIDVSNTDKTYEIHTDVQKSFLDGQDPSATIIGASTFEQSKPNPINLDYKIETDNGARTTSETVVVSEKEDLSDAKEIDAHNLYNLKVGTQYYFKVKAKFKTVETVSEVSTFTVADAAPRNIYLDTMGNFRDLGGWKIGTDKVVKQGMIYRSPEFNKSYTGESLLSGKDLNYVVQDLGIKTDIDLRTNYSETKGYENAGITTSPLGSTVRYQYCGMKFQSQNILTRTDNKDNIKVFFDTLADETVYPVVFHCAQGKDRTGCMAFLVNALLGVSTNDLEMDYMFTNFTEYGGSLLNIRKDVEQRYFATIAQYKTGDYTFAQKTYAYLNEQIGVSTQNLDKIISLLTETK